MPNFLPSFSFAEHVLTVIGQSENRTLALLDTVYRRPPRLGHPPVSALYDSIRKHVISFNEADAKETSDVTTLPASIPNALDKAVRQFFERLFPLAYHHIAHFGLTDFTEEYKQCLMRNYDEVIAIILLLFFKGFHTKGV